MQSSTITQKGQVTIPADLRQALDLHPGDAVEFKRINNDKVVLTKQKNDISAAFGMYSVSHKVSLLDIQEAIEKGATDDSH